MGKGGYMILTNGTPYRWKRSDQMSYQMKSWDFPEVIEAGKSYHPSQKQFLTCLQARFLELALSLVRALSRNALILAAQSSTLLKAQDAANAR
jgi:hypothetical protein